MGISLETAFWHNSLVIPNRRSLHSSQEQEIKIEIDCPKSLNLTKSYGFNDQ